MLISLAEYAKAHDRDPATIRQRVLRGTLPAVKVGRNWCIEDGTPLDDHRCKQDSNPTD